MEDASFCWMKSVKHLKRLYIQEKLKRINSLNFQEKLENQSQCLAPSKSDVILREIDGAIVHLLGKIQHKLNNDTPPQLDDVNVWHVPTDLINSTDPMPHDAAD